MEQPTQRFAYLVPIGTDDDGTPIVMATLVRPLDGPVHPIRLTAALEKSLFTLPPCSLFPEDTIE